MITNFLDNTLVPHRLPNVAASLHNISHPNGKSQANKWTQLVSQQDCWDLTKYELSTNMGSLRRGSNRNGKGTDELHLQTDRIQKHFKHKVRVTILGMTEI